MRFYLFVSFLSTFLLGACSSTAAYQQQMQQWHGKNIQVLQRSWGQPNSAIKLANGHRLYQYTRKNFYTIPEPRRQSINNTVFASYDEPWLSNQTMVRYCRTTFETNSKGDIVHTSFKGNNCLAFRFTR
ncbi:MAG: hypothetical protein REH83_03085 [Rickettsiella sp.]|nr:hypothetical protein [Rickettsiella sp.]